MRKQSVRIKDTTKNGNDIYAGKWKAGQQDVYSIASRYLWPFADPSGKS